MSVRRNRLNMKWHATVRDLRLGWQLWWLRQQVEFLEWRMQWNVLVPQPVMHGEWISRSSGGRRGVQTLSWAHGQEVVVRSVR
jgi:hypothetical protein